MLRWLNACWESWKDGSRMAAVYTLEETFSTRARKFQDGGFLSYGPADQLLNVFPLGTIRNTESSAWLLSKLEGGKPTFKICNKTSSPPCQGNQLRN